MSERKVHVLPDDNLGGVLREFVEVDRKAKVGDLIKVVKAYDENQYDNGGVYVVREIDNCIRIDSKYGGTVFMHKDEYVVIEPADIVHINGARYRLVDRKAKVGEKVMYYKDGKSDGVVTTCIGYDERFNDCIDVEPYLTKDGDEETCGFADGYYRVLEPIYTCDKCGKPLGETACSNQKGGSYCSVDCAKDDDESEASKSVLDLLASLAQKIVELERKIDRLEERTESNARDIETWAQEVTRLTDNQSVTLTFDSATIAKIMAKVVAEWR